MIAVATCILPGMALQQRSGGSSRPPLHRSLARALPLARSSRRSLLVVRASKEEDEKKKILALEDSLKQSGLDKERAQQVLKLWQSASGGEESKEITPEELRKVLVKQGSKFSGLVLIQVFLDIGAAYGAFVAGTFLGDAVQQYGYAAVALQAVAFFLSGYYAIGAFFDLFKLGMLLTAISQFNVNSAAFLAAVKDLAGDSPAGLSTVDKAVEAVNTLKVVSGLNKMAGLLKEQQQDKSSNEMLKDLAAYLTLEKAQRLYGFDAAKYGITDAQAADIATVFSAFDADDNGVLSLDEFQRLCAKYAPELSGAEVKAGLQLLDKNGDGIIQLGEFVEWWLKEVQHSAKAP